MSLMFAICHMFSRRRHSQNRRIENAPFIESFMVISKTAVKNISTVRFEGYTVVISKVVRVCNDPIDNLDLFDRVYFGRENE
mgnify:CR=1 FL=1